MTIQADGKFAVEAQLAVVNRALDATYKRAIEVDKINGDIRVLNIATDRYIIFSDVHRGARNRADDFLRAERAYNAALAYYLKMGYTLITLGDIEELWEERPAVVIKAYPRTFALEAQFHQQGRYFRVWGNHDDEWQYAERVQQLLHKVYGDPPLLAHESLRFRVLDGEKELGMLFLIHGHQGDLKSDRFSALSRLIVRYIWRPLQRLTGIYLNTPAHSWSLREKYNIAMYNWAKKQRGLVLIAGHTHRPVFKSQSHEMQIREQLAEMETKAGDTPTPEQIKEMAKLLAEVEWVVAQPGKSTGKALHGLWKGLACYLRFAGFYPRFGAGPIRDVDKSMTKPCYFNTGCSSYNDGDITGLEIADGDIRLVRWPDKEKKPRPYELAVTSLREVFSKV